MTQRRQAPKQIPLKDGSYLEEISLLAERWGLSRQQARHLLLDLQVPMLCLPYGVFYDPAVLTDVIKDMLAWRSVGYAAPSTRARQYPERYGNPAVSAKQLDGFDDEEQEDTGQTNEPKQPEKPTIEVSVQPEPRPATVDSGGGDAASTTPPQFVPIPPASIRNR